MVFSLPAIPAKRKQGTVAGALLLRGEFWDLVKGITPNPREGHEKVRLQTRVVPFE